MRIVFDVSPLSHPLTGIGNYVRGSLGGLIEAAGGEHDIVAFAPTSPAGRKAIPCALEGVDVELALADAHSIVGRGGAGRGHEPDGSPDTAIVNTGRAYAALLRSRIRELRSEASA